MNILILGGTGMVGHRLWMELSNTHNTWSTIRCAAACLPDIPYGEDDSSDAEDLYGKTRFLGEVTTQLHCLTIRSSFVGRELVTHYGLVEWFLSQTHKVTGYQKAIFSGFTTQAFAETLRDYVLPQPDLHGLYHISTDPISKYDLLHLLNTAYNKNLEIMANTDIVIDCSLDSTRFRQLTGFKSPTWSDMITAMAADSTPYDRRKTQ